MKTIGMLIIGLAVGAGAGYFAGQHTKTTKLEHLHELNALVDVENIVFDFEIINDPMGGQKLHVITENFMFTPEKAGQDHAAGEGHAHVFVDGEFSFLYSNWLHIKGDSGDEVTVSLNGNDHATLVQNDQPLSLTKTIP